MKIKSIDAWKLNLPRSGPHPAARRPSYLASAPHVFPIGKYPEFPRVVKDIPGVVLPEIWIRVTAEDGTWGLVRASSNKPELVVVVESPVSSQRRLQMFDAVDAVLRRSPEVGAYNQTF